jgi:hypothetical protein
MEITTEALEQCQENKLKFIEQTSNMEIMAITGIQDNNAELLPFAADQAGIFMMPF